MSAMDISSPTTLKNHFDDQYQEGRDQPPTVHILPEELTDQSAAISSTDITLSEYLKDNYTSNTGASVSEYLINNYPPRISFDGQQENPASMVPLRKASYSSNHSESNQDESKELEEKLQANNIDDEELKKARRRMKNKISAQESRRRKKEYVDALELKMKQRDQEKKLLTEKVTELEEKVRLLVDELFQAKQNQNDNVSSSAEHHHSKTTSEVATQTGICLHCFNHNSMGVAKHGSASNEKEDKIIPFETNIESLDANCHEYEVDRRHPMYDRNSMFKREEPEEQFQHYFKYHYENYRNDYYERESFNRVPNSAYEKREDRRVYYDKPYIRRTASVSPSLLKLNPSSPPATCTSPLRSNSSPLRSSAFSPRIPTESTHHLRRSDSYTYSNRQNISLYSQLLDAERQISPTS